MHPIHILQYYMVNLYIKMAFKQKIVIWAVEANQSIHKIIFILEKYYWTLLTTENFNCFDRNGALFCWEIILKLYILCVCLMWKVDKVNARIKKI